MSMFSILDGNLDEAIYLPQSVGDIVKDICSHSISESVKSSADVYITSNTFLYNVKRKLSMDMSYYVTRGAKLNRYDVCELYSMIDNSELFNNKFNKRIIKHNNSL